MVYKDFGIHKVRAPSQPPGTLVLIMGVIEKGLQFVFVKFPSLEVCLCQGVRV